VRGLGFTSQLQIAIQRINPCCLINEPTHSRPMQIGYLCFFELWKQIKCNDIPCCFLCAYVLADPIVAQWTIGPASMQTRRKQQGMSLHLICFQSSWIGIVLSFCIFPNPIKVSKYTSDILDRHRQLFLLCTCNNIVHALNWSVALAGGCAGALPMA
jgi:hypothetical protein